MAARNTDLRNTILEMEEKSDIQFDDMKALVKNYLILKVF